MKAYIREMLELNPMWQSAQIIRRRNELWSGSLPRSTQEGVSAKAPMDPQVEARLQERASRCLQIVQLEFYQLPEDKLREHLRFLRNDRLPEFAARAKRFSEVAKCRNELLGIERETGDVKFAYSLQQGVIGSAAQSGSLKEQYIEAIIAENRVHSSCQMIASFVERHPRIYELERDWFDLFLDPANRKRWSQGNAFSVSSLSGMKLVGIAMFIAASIIVPLSRASNRSPRNPPYQSSYPAQQPVRPPVYQVPTVPQPPVVPALKMPDSMPTGAIPSGGIANELPPHFRSSMERGSLNLDRTASERHEELMREIRERRNRSHQEIMDRIKEIQKPIEVLPPYYAPPRFTPPSFSPSSSTPRPSFSPPNFPRSGAMPGGFP